MKTALIAAFIVLLPTLATAADPCAPNNGGADCTPTEEILYNFSHDCYTCLVQNDCVDNTTNFDTGLECEDVSGVAAAGARTGMPRAALCLGFLSCMLRSTCWTGDAEICYCGSLGAGGGCSTGVFPEQADGACKAQVLDATESTSSTTPADVVARLTSSTPNGASQAFNIMSCARIFGCDSCWDRGDY